MSEPLRQAQRDLRWRRRHRAAARFKLYGLLSIAAASAALVGLLGSIVVDGIGGFTQHVVELEIDFDPEAAGLSDSPTPDEIAGGNYARWVRAALQEQFPNVSGRRDRRDLLGLVSSGAAFELRTRVEQDLDLLGTRQTVTLPLDDDSDLYYKGKIDASLPEGDRVLGDKEIAWLDALDARGLVSRTLNWYFLGGGASREAELAGVWGAVVGSFLTLSVTLILCFPIGVATAIYLEEFALRNRWSDLIEVNINNLAAVPSIVFGLLGLAVFLNFFGLPRSAPLVGGLVLALMTLPTIIIASRAAIQAVPPSIRDAALGMGASKLQVVLHHVLPLAMPGMMTGTIIGMAQALGETAPLLMIGMVAFIVDIPGAVSSPATVLPVQIFLWADAPERAFEEKTAAAIIVLLAFLIVMNLLAVFLRRRFEHQW